MSQFFSTVSRAQLAQEALARYEPGTGPWSKEGPLDQVDLVFLEEMTHLYSHFSDPRGLLSGCVNRLVDEVRHARGWEPPPDVAPGSTLPEACMHLVEDFARRHCVTSDGVDALRALAAQVVALEDKDDPDVGDKWERLELNFREDFYGAPWNGDDFPDHLSDFVVAVATSAKEHGR